MSPKDERRVFSLYGPTQSGKSRLIAEMVRRLPRTIGIIKSVTTRPKRGAEDEANYSRHLSDEEFKAMIADGRFVQYVTYADFRYGTASDDLDSVLAARHGICAMTEDGMRNMRDKGYRVVPVQVIPVNAPDDLEERAHGDLRAIDDHARAMIQVQPLIVVVNDFKEGGFDRAAGMLERDMRTFIPYEDLR